MIERKPPQPVVVVHIDENGNHTWRRTAGVRLFIIDENVPRDRVYEIMHEGALITHDEVGEFIGEGPIGNCHDGVVPWDKLKPQG